jgi:hypothetical protein
MEVGGYEKKYVCRLKRCRADEIRKREGDGRNIT